MEGHTTGVSYSETAIEEPYAETSIGDWVDAEGAEAAVECRLLVD